MTTNITCPDGTRWCTEHQHEVQQCVSRAIRIEGGHCDVWLLQELPGLEPTIKVDTPPAGADLTLDQAGDLRDALQQLLQAATDGTEVRS